MMSTTRTDGTGRGGAVSFRIGCCGFPECEQAAATSAGMCELHRRVSVSATGSWLEAG